MSSQPELLALLCSFSLTVELLPPPPSGSRTNQWCFMHCTHEPTSSNRTFLSFAERLLWPELLCGRAPSATCVGNPVCYRWCFTLSGLTYLSGVQKKTFPGNRHIPQTALECFYRRPGDLQRQVWLRLPSSSPDIVYCYFCILREP